MRVENVTFVDVTVVNVLIFNVMSANIRIVDVFLPNPHSISMFNKSALYFNVELQTGRLCSRLVRLQVDQSESTGLDFPPPDICGYWDDLWFLLRILVGGGGYQWM